MGTGRAPADRDHVGGSGEYCRGSRPGGARGALARGRDSPTGRIGAPQPVPERIATEQVVARSRATLGEQSWAAAFSAGHNVLLEQIIAEALERQAAGAA